MAMDPDIVGQLNTAHARGIAMGGTFSEQHMAMITVGAQFDMRLMNGFLANQLFNQGLVEAKSAFHTPVEPGAAPVPTPVATK